MSGEGQDPRLQRGSPGEGRSRTGQADDATMQWIPVPSESGWLRARSTQTTAHELVLQRVSAG